MKYKIGDKVRVRNDLEKDKYYGSNCVIDQMLPFCGKIVTIEKYYGTEYGIEGSSYNWTDEMFEERIPKYKIGGKVQIKETLCEGLTPEKLNILPDMLVYAGKVVTISSINFETYGIVYSIKEDNNSYSWPESILKPIEDINSDYIPCVGDKVLIRGDLISDSYYDDIYFSKYMKLYCDMILTITGFTDDSNNSFYVAENNYIWSSEMVKMKVQDDFNPELPSKEKNILPEVEEELFLIIPKIKPKLFLI